MLLDVFAGLPVMSHIHKLPKQTTLHPPILKLTYQLQYSTLSRIPISMVFNAIMVPCKGYKGIVNIHPLMPELNAHSDVQKTGISMGSA